MLVEGKSLGRGLFAQLRKSKRKEISDIDMNNLKQGSALKKYRIVNNIPEGLEAAFMAKNSKVKYWSDLSRRCVSLMEIKVFPHLDCDVNTKEGGNGLLRVHSSDALYAVVGVGPSVSFDGNDTRYFDTDDSSLNILHVLSHYRKGFGNHLIFLNTIFFPRFFHVGHTYPLVEDEMKDSSLRLFCFNDILNFFFAVFAVVIMWNQ
jgi:hypothetical protein